MDPVQALRQIAFELERGGAHATMWSFSADETGGRSSQLPSETTVALSMPPPPQSAEVAF